MYKVLVEKLEEKRPLARPELKWKDHITINLKRSRMILQMEFVKLNQLENLVNMVMSFWVP